MSSTVPGALNALTRSFGTTQTTIGAPAQRPAEFVAVAWAGPDNGAVTMVDSPASASMVQSLEVYDVICQIRCVRDGIDPTAPIARVYAIRDVLRGNLIADWTLGGAVMQAEITDSVLSIDQSEPGAIATLQVTVNVQAQRT